MNHKPFLLKAAGKDYLWGGEKLKQAYHQKINLSPLAEAWVCSTHEDGPSTIVSGEYTDQSLKEVILQHPEYLGTHPVTKTGLPVLIKLIDARKDLSVQVHPTDAYACQHEHGQSGKTEMWYVLEAEKDSSLIYGFETDVKAEEIRRASANGTIAQYLQKVPVEKGNVFFIPAGTVHAIGKGIVVAEIQESSNLTYRLYDYNRIDKDGRKRPLQIEKALAVADLHRAKEPVQPMRVLKYRPGFASELLCRCRYFQVERILLNRRDGILYQTDSNSFRVLLCIEGSGQIEGEEISLSFETGSCIFIPAESIALSLSGTAQLLQIEC